MVRMMMCALPASLLALVPPARAEDVELRFAWPAGRKISVVHEMRSERSTPHGPSTSTYASHYDLFVERRGDGLALRRDLLLDTKPRPRPGTNDTFFPPVPFLDNADVQILIDVLSERIPVVLVSADGEFRGIEGAGETAKEMDLKLERSHFPATVRDRVRRLVTPEGLRSLAADHWNAQFAVWSGLRLTVGKPVALRKQAAPPALEMQIDITFEGRLTRRLPCTEKEAGPPRCVELVATSRTDPTQVAAVVRAYGVHGPRRIKSAHLSRTLTLVVQPESLLPHRCRFEISARGEYADGGAVTLEEVTRSWTFTHAQEPAPARP